MSNEEIDRFKRLTEGAVREDVTSIMVPREMAQAVLARLAIEEPWPVPGKPETYSERYHMFHRMLCKDEPLTHEEAIEVWNAEHALLGAVPEGGLIGCLNRRLADELRTGKRCGVCGKYSDPACTLDC